MSEAIIGLHTECLLALIQKIRGIEDSMSDILKLLNDEMAAAHVSLANHSVLVQQLNNHRVDTPPEALEILFSDLAALRKRVEDLSKAAQDALGSPQAAVEPVPAMVVAPSDPPAPEAPALPPRTIPYHPSALVGADRVDPAPVIAPPLPQGDRPISS